jgi:septal ring factor EnvC (AmiA/AmiB activator)
MITSSFPQLGWLAPQAAPVAQNTPDVIAPTAPATPSPDQQQLNAMSLDLDAVRQSVDRIAASQEQMTRNVDQLTAGQEQLTREITKLQAIQQYMLYKSSEPPAPKPVPRSSQARTAR